MNCRGFYRGDWEEEKGERRLGGGEGSGKGEEEQGNRRMRGGLTGRAGRQGIIVNSHRAHEQEGFPK